ncbi:MAG TPA: sigma-70 family RNA polymerase sigma factor [Steroidobacteraceae bacterium]|nr:sigma-70 family RNA polymerase sigma factor [Steroidobacteraceae bacterium]
MPSGDVTRLLAAAGSGDRLAFDRLYRAVYDELHRMARSNMRREGRAMTLQPTALVNEAYLRLARDAPWENRRHFFGAAAEAMRRILVDYARQRLAQKRGGEIERVTLTGIDVPAAEPDLDVLALDEALTLLEAERPRLAQLVAMRFFAGMSIEDAARALGVSPATAKRDWAFARAWLHDNIRSRT